MTYTGPYKGIFNATVAILVWAKENKVKWDTLKKKGVVWWNGCAEIYFSDIAIEKGSKKFNTELVFFGKTITKSDCHHRDDSHIIPTDKG